MSGPSSVLRFAELGKKVVGIGLNYRGLVEERGVSMPTIPLVFLKATSSYIQEGQCIKLPPGSEVAHEIELGLIIGQKCKKISESDAMKYVAGYCLALDMTDQKEVNLAKKQGMPWTFGKSFDTACPVSRFISKEELPDPLDANIWCKVNGEVRQDACVSDMIFSIPYVLSYISQRVTLEPGDLILTGSPAGVSLVKPGDSIEGGIDDILEIKFNVACE